MFIDNAKISSKIVGVIALLAIVLILQSSQLEGEVSTFLSDVRAA